MSASDQQVVSDVEKVGWHVVLVSSDEMTHGFAFTIGLFHTYQHPEVILFGLPHKVAVAVLNLIGTSVKSGHRLQAGDRSDEFLEGYSCAFVDFPRTSYHDFLGYAKWYYKGEEFPALQCVWPDREGRFPWDLGA